MHDKFDLVHETLFLTVNLIDRFLEKHSVVRKKLQLVGLVAMLLACKYEEVSVPVVGDLILISDRAYSRKEVLEMVTFFACLLSICGALHMTNQGLASCNPITVSAETKKTINGIVELLQLAVQSYQADVLLSLPGL